jgi:NDP-sugar pyrophosphorylase family protein
MKVAILAHGTSPRLSEETVNKPKAQDAEGWINGVFFVLEPVVSDYIEGARYS